MIWVKDIARAAYARALEARLEVEPLLESANLTPHEITNSHVRMLVKNQIQFLSVVADGLHLAENIELREMGLPYYVIASSETLGDALMRLARYSGLTNEGVRVTCHEGKDTRAKFEYVGVSRLSDRHQIECFVVILVRLCRLLTGRSLSPIGVKLAHRRTELPAEIKKVFSCEVSFGSSVDEVIYPRTANSMATVNSDSYLNSLLVRYCEEALSSRREQSGAWRLKVENAIVPLLPYGQAKIGEIAKTLGVSTRTPRQILFARTKSAKFRSSVAFRICRTERIFSRLQTVDWQDTEATTICGSSGLTASIFSCGPNHI